MNDQTGSGPVRLSVIRRFTLAYLSDCGSPSSSFAVPLSVRSMDVNQQSRRRGGREGGREGLKVKRDGPVSIDSVVIVMGAFTDSDENSARFCPLRRQRRSIGDVMKI